MTEHRKARFQAELKLRLNSFQVPKMRPMSPGLLGTRLMLWLLKHLMEFLLTEMYGERAKDFQRSGARDLREDERCSPHLELKAETSDGTTANQFRTEISTMAEHGDSLRDAIAALRASD